MGQFEPLSRPVAAESALRAIYRVIGDWMPPDSELDDRDVIELITQILESHGMPFVADEACGQPLSSETAQAPAYDQPPNQS